MARPDAEEQPEAEGPCPCGLVRTGVWRITRPDSLGPRIGQGLRNRPDASGSGMFHPAVFDRLTGQRVRASSTVNIDSATVGPLPKRTYGVLPE